MAAVNLSALEPLFEARINSVRHGFSSLSACLPYVWARETLDAETLISSMALCVNASL